MTTATSQHSIRQTIMDSVRVIGNSLAGFVRTYESNQQRLLKQGEIEVPLENNFAVIAPRRRE